MSRGMCFTSPLYPVFNVPLNNLNILEPCSFVKYFFRLHILTISGFLGTRAFSFPWRDHIMP